MRRTLAAAILLAMTSFFLGPVDWDHSATASSKQLVLAGNFSGKRLTTQQEIQIERFIRSNPGSAKLLCTGFLPNRLAGKSNVISKSFAETACNFAGDINRELTIISQGKAQPASAKNGKLVLQIVADSNVSSSYLDCDTKAVDTNMPAISQKNVMVVACAEDRQTPSSALARSTQSSTPAICEINDVSQERLKFNTLMVGFPRHTNNIASVGKVKVTVLPVDWADFPGTDKPQQTFKVELDKYRDYYKMVSYGKLELNLQVSDRWFRLPGKMLDYKVTEEDYRQPYSERTKEQKTKLFQNGVSAADPFVDFTNTDMVIFLLPPGQSALDVTLQAFWNGDLPKPAESNEGLLKNFMVAGNAFPQRMYWSYWAHEFGHGIMLPDWYVNSGNFGNYETLQIPIGPFSGYDLMSTNGGPSMTMSVWSRWMMNWLDNSNIFCSDYASFKSSSFVLDPIDNQNKKLKSVIIRVSETKAVLIESRRKTGFDEPTLRSRNGVLVYTIDTSIGHGEGAKVLVAPKGRGLYYPFKGKAGAPQLDAILYLGNFVETNGLRITVNAVGATDIVSIEKITTN